MLSLRSLLIASIGCLAVSSVAGQTLKREGYPSLRINAPFVSPLWRIDVHAASGTLVMGSGAKAVAVWSMRQPADTPVIHRVPIRDEQRQRAHAIAIHPDGQRMAYSVPPLANSKGGALRGTARVYIINQPSGRIEHVIEGLSTRAQDLAFSADGKYLAAGLSDGCGLRLWKTDTWLQIGYDDNGYSGQPGISSCCPENANVDCGHLPDTTSVAFRTTDGVTQSVLTSGATGVRHYVLDEQVTAPSQHWTPDELGVGRPDGIAIHPDGVFLAIGDRSPVKDKDGLIALRVGILNLESGRLLTHLTYDRRDVIHPGYLDTSQAPGATQMNLNRVAWQLDGTRWMVVAGGVAWCQIGQRERIRGPVSRSNLDNCLVQWQFDPGNTERSSPMMLRAGLDRVMDLKAVGLSGAIAFASQRQISVIDPTGHPVAFDDNTIGPFDVAASLFDFRDRLKNVSDSREYYLDFAVADNGTVYFEDFRSSEQLPAKISFDPQQLNLRTYTDLPADARSAIADPLHVNAARYWKNQYQSPELFGIESILPANRIDRYRSVATLENGYAAVGSSNFVRLIKVQDGTAQVLCQLRVAAEVFRIHLSSDHKLIVAGHGDGSLRWYGIEFQKDHARGVICRMVPRLSVVIRETRPNSGEWTWLALLPSSGHFAADPNARNLIEWQIEGPGGQIERVDTRLLWQPLLRPSIVQQALSGPPPASGLSDRLINIIRERTDPSQIGVLSPAHKQAILKPELDVRLIVTGGKLAGRKLWVRTGGGIGISKVVDGRTVGENEPIILGNGDDTRLLKFEIELPDSVRRLNGEHQLCFALDDWAKGCQTFIWSGQLAPPKPLKLHAVVVGVANYMDAALNLNATDNDAIDFASLFITDYKNRVVAKTSKILPDFVAAEFDLLISSSGALRKQQELENLAREPNVRAHAVNRASLLSVLDGLVERAKSDTKHDHRFIFYFAGHGYIDFESGAGKTAFLLPKNNTNGHMEHVLGQEITDRLERLRGSKIAIFDACRNPLGERMDSRFDPARLEQEFASRGLTITMIFGSKAGQVAREQSDLVLGNRPVGEAGNGIFTYALVKALTSPEADTSRDKVGKDRIELIEIEQYLHYFFDPSNDAAPSSTLRRSLSADDGQYLQQPSIVRARNNLYARRWLRTLDKKNPERSGVCSWPYLRNWELLCR